MWLLALFACDSQRTENETIEVHLAQVEERLRAQEGSGQRAHLLAALTGYRHNGVFPHNHVSESGRTRPVEVEGAFDDRPGATPVFVDEHDTPCAVAHLMRVSGATELVDRIQRTRNTAYVHELVDVPGVGEWVASSGFTLDELAQIQPGYSFRCRPEEVIGLASHAATGLTAGSTLASAVYLAEGRRPWGSLAVGTAGSGLMIGAGHLSRRKCGPEPLRPNETWGEVAFYGGFGMLAANVGGFVLAALQKPGAKAPVQVSLGPNEVGLHGRF